MNALQVAERSAVYALEDAVAPATGETFDLLATAPQGVAKLRQLILSLAIQGRLCRRGGTNGGSTDQPFDTPKEPRETPSRADRDTPARQRDMGVIGPFHIPATWQWSALGEVVDVIRGITFPASEKRKSPDEGLIACLRTANVQNVIEWDDLLYVNRSFMHRDDQRVRPMDIIMSMANSKDLVGKVALVDDGPPKEATIGGFIAILRTQDMDPRYLMGVLRSDYVRLTLIDSSSQTTNIANISLAKLRPLPIPLPPLAEQRRIVARVEELMCLCDELETRGRLQDEQHARLVATLFDALVASASPKELADNWQRVARHFDLLLDRPEAVDALEQTILQLAVRGLFVNRSVSEGTGVNAPDADGKSSEAQNLPIPYELPASWRWVTADDVCTAITDGEHQTPHRVPDHKAVPLVTAKNVRDEHFDLDRTDFVARATAEKCWERCKPRPGDILMVSVGATLGRLAILRTPVDMVLVRSVTVLRPDESLVCSDYLALHLRSPQTQRDIWRSVKQSAQPCLYLGRSKQLRLAIPPLAEQNRIVARVEELRGLCVDLRQHLQQAQTTQTNLADALAATVTHGYPPASV